MGSTRYKYGTRKKLKQGLNETPWHIVLGNCDDVHEMVYTFTNILNGIMFGIHS